MVPCFPLSRFCASGRTDTEQRLGIGRRRVHSMLGPRGQTAAMSVSDGRCMTLMGASRRDGEAGLE